MFKKLITTLFLFGIISNAGAVTTEQCTHLADKYFNYALELKMGTGYEIFKMYGDGVISKTGTQMLLVKAREDLVQHKDITDETEALITKCLSNNTAFNKLYFQ